MRDPPPGKKDTKVAVFSSPNKWKRYRRELKRSTLHAQCLQHIGSFFFFSFFCFLAFLPTLVLLAAANARRYWVYRDVHPHTHTFRVREPVGIVPAGHCVSFFFHRSAWCIRSLLSFPSLFRLIARAVILAVVACQSMSRQSVCVCVCALVFYKDVVTHLVNASWRCVRVQRG